MISLAPRTELMEVTSVFERGSKWKEKVRNQARTDREWKNHKRKRLRQRDKPDLINQFVEEF